MSQGHWTAVDHYMAGRLVSPDHALDAVVAANQCGGRTTRDRCLAVAGQALHLLTRIAGGCKVLEIGTLGGYSTSVRPSLPRGGCASLDGLGWRCL